MMLFLIYYIYAIEEVIMAKNSVHYELVDWSKPLSEIAKEIGCSYTALRIYAKKNGIKFVPGDPRRKKPDWVAIETDFRAGMHLFDIFDKYRGSGICERVLYRRAAKWDPILFEKQGFDPTRYSN
jgi:hypothetical protein